MKTVKQVFKPDLEWLRSIGCSVYTAAELVMCDASHLRRVLIGERKSYRIMFRCCTILTPRIIETWRNYKNGDDSDENLRILYYRDPFACEEGCMEFEEWKAEAKRLEAEGRF